MRRRSFIKKSIIGGIGVSLIPSISFSKNIVEYIEIGPLSIHHRHGNMFNSSAFKINHPIIKSINRECFFGNGFCQGDKDAFHVEIQTKNSYQREFIMPNNSNLYSGTVTLKNCDLLVPLSPESKIAILTNCDCSLDLKGKYYKLSIS